MIDLFLNDLFLNFFKCLVFTDACRVEYHIAYSVEYHIACST